MYVAEAALDAQAQGKYAVEMMVVFAWRANSVAMVMLVARRVGRVVGLPPVILASFVAQMHQVVHQLGGSAVAVELFAIHQLEDQHAAEISWYLYT